MPQEDARKLSGRGVTWNFPPIFFFFFLELHQQWEGWKKERELMTLARPLRITKIFFPKKERLFLARNGSEKKENSAAHKDQNTAINRESVLTLGITFAAGTNIWAFIVHYYLAQCSSFLLLFKALVLFPEDLSAAEHLRNLLLSLPLCVDACMSEWMGE